MMIQRTRFIGSEGAAFERVGLAFACYDLEVPHPDIIEGSGAYVANIVTQYQGALSESQVLALVEYGLTNSREVLIEERDDPSLLMYTLDELTDRYLEQAS